MDLVLVFLAKKRPRARDNERKSYNNITPAHYGNVAETQNPWGNERPRPESQVYTPYRHRKELYLKTLPKKPFPQRASMPKTCVKNVDGV